MLKNYFKIAWRNLVKNKTASFINICGLAVGLATSIIIMLLVIDEFSYNKFHAHLRDIHSLMINQRQTGGVSTSRSTPGPLAASLRSAIPEIKYAARTSGEGEELIKYGDNLFYERTVYADPDYFRIMSFPALQGDPAAALKEAGSVVVTERVARKLFGKDDPIGKILVHNSLHALKVQAVIRDIPANSSNQFDIVLPFRILEQENSDWINKWDNNRLSTWVQLQPGANLAVTNGKLKKLFRDRTDDPAEELFAYPFADLRLYGNFSNGKPNGGMIYIVILLSVIGGFVLLIACINFMNLATAQSARRAREVGVRKTLGASRKFIAFQFLTEALLMTFLALLLGVLAARLALPAFNRFFEKNISFDISNGRIWLGLLGIGLFTGLVAGSYPALFLSRFLPVKVLKGGALNEKGGSMPRKILVSCQFVISIFMMIGTIVIYKQIEHIQDRPLGYDQANLIDITARGDMSDKFDLLKTDLAQVPGVQQVSAGSDDLIRFGGGINGMDWTGKTPDQEFAVTITWVQYDWAKTAGLKMAEGRDYSPDFGSDTSACLLNQTAVRKMGLKAPVIGKIVGGRPVIGVVEDFVFNNPSGTTGPMAIWLGKKNMNHVFVRIQNDNNWRRTVARIGELVKKNNPDYPFEYHFTREKYQERLEQIGRIEQLATLFGGMALFISCLGLFALSTFLAERRAKEIGIRKVLGASVGSVWLTLSQDFLKPVLIAFLIAAPLAGWAMQKLLMFMDYRIQLSWWMFALAGVLAIVIAVGTISYQGMKAALANPVKSLRAE